MARVNWPAPAAQAARVCQTLALPAGVRPVRCPHLSPERPLLRLQLLHLRPEHASTNCRGANYEVPKAVCASLSLSLSKAPRRLCRGPPEPLRFRSLASRAQAESLPMHGENGLTRRQFGALLAAVPLAAASVASDERSETGRGQSVGRPPPEGPPVSLEPGAPAERKLLHAPGSQPGLPAYASPTPTACCTPSASSRNPLEGPASARRVEGQTSSCAVTSWAITCRLVR